MLPAASRGGYPMACGSNGGVTTSSLTLNGDRLGRWQGLVASNSMVVPSETVLEGGVGVSNSGGGADTSSSNDGSRQW